MKRPDGTRLNPLLFEATHIASLWDAGELLIPGATHEVSGWDAAESITISKLPI